MEIDSSAGELNGWFKKLDNEAVYSITPQLVRCSNLKVLRLDCNSIGCDGVAALAAAITECRQIAVLRLNSNYIGDVGVLFLAAVLPHLPDIVYLDLSSNYIGNGGAYALSKHLPKCRRLQFLDLKLNRIGRLGLIHLNRAIKFTPTHIYLPGVKNDVPRNLGRWELLALLGATNGAAGRFVCADGDRAISWRVLGYLIGHI